MAGKVIGKVMNYGWAGKITRDADMIIDSRIVSDASGSTAIAFGSPVFLNEDNTVRNFASATDNDATMLAGIAVSGVRQSINYATQLADYQPATQCDILTRGQVMVAIPSAAAASVVAGGAVYLDASAGTFTPVATSNITTGYKFTTGIVDPNYMVEITIPTKNVL